MAGSSGRARAARALIVLTAMGTAAFGWVATATADTPSDENAEVVATLEIDRDHVEVRPDGKRSFGTAEDGQLLHEGDTVRTDNTGHATIKYGDEAFTRLDVATTFTVALLDEDEGARHTKGHLEVGRTWNRVEDLTESGSFEVEGAGATAAVQGTAFVVQCTSVDECDFTGVYHDVLLTDTSEEALLGPMHSVKVHRGDAGDLVRITLAQVVTDEWIQGNLLADLWLGFGPGPFSLPRDISPGEVPPVPDPVIDVGGIVVTEPPPPPPPPSNSCGYGAGCAGRANKGGANFGGTGNTMACTRNKNVACPP